MNGAAAQPSTPRFLSSPPVAWSIAMTDIRPDCIRRPGIPLLRNATPTGAKPYKVQDGDTWATLARRMGMDAWELIRFNFPNIPDDLNAASLEVNWYMRENVGCHVVTPDGRNFRFSSSARPGLIYLPVQPRAASPAAPKQVVEIRYWRFWTALPYIHKAMLMDAQSQDAAEILELSQAEPAMAADRWTRLVRPNGRWDHDSEMRRMLAIDLDLHFPVEGDPSHEYFYGVWIEIHHGFVAASVGLPAFLLATGNPIDDECLRLGASLWCSHGKRLSAADLAAAFDGKRSALLAMQESAAYLEAVGVTGHRHIHNITNGE